MAIRWVGAWAGGRVSVRRDGRSVWHLERMLDGVRHRIALDVDSEDPGALGELALWNRDPRAYLRSRDQTDAARIGIDADLVEAFDAHLRAEGRTLRYRRNVHTYMSAWLVELAGRPLADVSLADLNRLLDKLKTARKHRIIALKSYCSWLRGRGDLDRADDPTLDLRVPPPRPEKAVREKGYALDHIAKLYAAVEGQDVRDILCVRAKTGMHETELGRVAAGLAVVREVWDPCGIAAVVRFVHKSGRQHLQSLDAQCLGAVRRLRLGYLERQARADEAGRAGPMDAIDNARVRHSIASAAQQARVAPVAPGELRHSFVTWREHGRLVRPKEGGVGLHEVAEIIGHRSARTTSTYYDGLAVPAMVVLPLALVHPGDPPVPTPPVEREVAPRGAQLAGDHASQAVEAPRRRRSSAAARPRRSPG